MTAPRGTPARWTAAMIWEARNQGRFPFAPRERVRAAQDRRVAATIGYAHAHVPYYRETMRRRLLAPGDIGTAHGLSRLPLIERSQVQADPEYFCSELWPPSRCTALHSGGSTGAPLTIFRDPPSMLLEAAHRERLRSLVARVARRRVRYREAAVIPPDSSVSTAIDAVKRTSLLPTSVRVSRRSFSMFRAPAELLGELEAYAPDVISSYGSYLEELLLEIRRRGWRGRRLRVATYEADGVSEQLLTWARDELDLVVLGSYDAIETPQIGFECEQHRGYHHNADLCALRLVDEAGETVGGDTEGQVVISNLVNRGTVLLNYVLGDLLTKLDAPCPCGRTLPLYSYLARSKSAWLHFAGGQRIHAQSLRLALRGEGGIQRYQIVQETPRSLLVRLVAAPGCDQEAAWARIIEAMSEWLPPQVSVQRDFVSDLPRGPGQKVQAVVPFAVS